MDAGFFSARKFIEERLFFYWLVCTVYIIDIPKKTPPRYTYISMFVFFCFFEHVVVNLINGIIDARDRGNVSRGCSVAWCGIMGFKTWKLCWIRRIPYTYSNDDVKLEKSHLTLWGKKDWRGRGRGRGREKRKGKDAVTCVEGRKRQKRGTAWCMRRLEEIHFRVWTVWGTGICSRVCEAKRERGGLAINNLSRPALKSVPRDYFGEEGIRDMSGMTPTRPDSTYATNFTLSGLPFTEMFSYAKINKVPVKVSFLTSTRDLNEVWSVFICLCRMCRQCVFFIFCSFACFFSLTPLDKVTAAQDVGRKSTMQS